MTTHIIVPVYTRESDNINNFRNNFISILEQGFPVKFILQDKNDRSVEILDNLNADYMFSYEFKHMHISPKINNQITGIVHLPKNTEIIVFIDADLYLPPLTIKKLIQPIKDKEYKISTGNRIINNNYILKSWSAITSTTNIGIYGGMFAVDYSWFMKNALEDFSNAYADDWSVYLSSKRTKTKIYYSDQIGFCKQYDSKEFLIRQYSWLKKYDPKIFYVTLLLEIFTLFLNPLKSIYMYYKTRCIKTSIYTMFLSFIIIYIQIIVIFKKDITWSGFKIKI
jgi:hypothetical protein